MALTSDNELYFGDDPRAEHNRLSLARGARRWPLWSRPLLSLGWAQRGTLGVMLALGLAITALYVAQGFLAAAALGRVLVDGRLDGVVALVAGAVALVGIRGVLVWGRDALGAAMGERVASALRSRVYRQLVRLGPGWLEQTRTGAVQTTLTEAVDALELYFRLFVTQAAVAGIGASAIALYLWTIDPIIGAFVSLCALGGGLGPMLAWRVLGPLEQFWWREAPALPAEFLDGMQGMPTLKALGAARSRRRELAARTVGVRDAWMSITRAEVVGPQPGLAAHHRRDDPVRRGGRGTSRAGRDRRLRAACHADPGARVLPPGRRFPARAAPHLQGDLRRRADPRRARCTADGQQLRDRHPGSPVPVGALRRGDVHLPHRQPPSSDGPELRAGGGRTCCAGGAIRRGQEHRRRPADALRRSLIRPDRDRRV